MFLLTDIVHIIILKMKKFDSPCIQWTSARTFCYTPPIMDCPVRYNVKLKVSGYFLNDLKNCKKPTPLIF
jgi:hypothetical protein